jgi:hypothetical protein
VAGICARFLISAGAAIGRIGKDVDAGSIAAGQSGTTGQAGIRLYATTSVTHAFGAVRKQANVSVLQLRVSARSLAIAHIACARVAVVWANFAFRQRLPLAAICA